MILKSVANIPDLVRAGEIITGRTARTSTISPEPVTKPASIAEIITPGITYEHKVPATGELFRQAGIVEQPITAVPQSAQPTTVNNKRMAWKPKTIAGKILKGAVIGGGTVLGIASGVGAVAGIASGAGALAGAAGGISTVAKAAVGLAAGIGRVVGKSASAVATGAVNLVTGTTATERRQVREVKAGTKAAQDQLDQVQRLIRAGASEEKALAMAGLSKQLLPEVNGVKISQNSPLYDLTELIKGKTAESASYINGQPLPEQKNNMPLYLAGAALVLLVLPKILKR